MINREITYERDVNRSYMKIPAVMETCLDEKLMFRKPYHGILPMEKCYVNGLGQYWYNISGKQALDAYCRMHSINQSFFETLILRICSQLELLEWNLMDSSCLVVDPELIFVNAGGDEISFILYPDTKGTFIEELQQLMEYLLTKLNHGDSVGVHQAYEIYNMVLKGDYSIAELKEAILKRREPEVLQHEEVEIPMVEEEIIAEEETDDIKKKIMDILEQVKGFLWTKKENKEEIPMVVYPDDEEEEKQMEAINPTICLAATLGEPRGILVYEGMGDYPDFELGQESSIIGKNPKVKLYLNRETISQFHAKLDYFDKNYYIEDMNSTNGTFVNEELLNYKEKRVLSSGDVIRFADVKYRFL